MKKLVTLIFTTILCVCAFSLHASAEGNVAKYTNASGGETEAYTLAEAFANVAENGTVTLLEDYTGSVSYAFITTPCTLDLNGKDASSFGVYAKADFTLKDTNNAKTGKIHGVSIENSANFTMESGEVIYRIDLINGTATINDGTIHYIYNQIQEKTDGSLTINDGTFDLLRAGRYANTTINGGTYTKIIPLGGLNLKDTLTLCDYKVLQSTEDTTQYYKRSEFSTTAITNAKVVTCPHPTDHINADTGKCECGKQYAVGYTTASGTAYTDDLATAFANVQSGGTVKLFTDYTESLLVEVTTSCTLDINGKVWEFLSIAAQANFTLKDTSADKTGKINGVTVMDSANFTMDSGEIINSMSISKGNATINGGTINQMYNSAQQQDYCLIINGGSVECLETGRFANTTINGGTYTNIAPLGGFTLKDTLTYGTGKILQSTTGDTYYWLKDLTGTELTNVEVTDCPHDTAHISATGLCECGTQMAASYTTASGTEYTDSLATAFKNVAENGTVTILQDMDTDASFDLRKACTLDLNGKKLLDTTLNLYVNFTLKSSGEANTSQVYTISVRNSSEFTMKSGRIKSTLEIVEGTATIDGGTIKILRNRSDGTLTVNDGEISKLQTSKDSTTTLYGGTFESIYAQSGEKICENITLGTGKVLKSTEAETYYRLSAQTGTELSNVSVVTCPHPTSDIDPTTGQCVCGKQYAASYTTDEGTEYTDNLYTAFSFVEENGTIKLLADDSKSSTFNLTHNCTLDLNGKTIGATIQPDRYKLTLKDTSEAQNGSVAKILIGELLMESGKVDYIHSSVATINGGTIGKLNHQDGTSLTINGGTITEKLYLNDKTVTLNGGTFAKIELYGSTIAEKVTLGSGLVLATAEHGPYAPDELNITELTNVTVQRCTHGKFTGANCGYCDFVCDSHNVVYTADTTYARITGLCHECLGTETYTLAAPTELEYSGSKKLATVTCANTNTTPEITYATDSTSAGSHTASITLGGATVSVSYTITPKALDLSLVTNYSPYSTYNGETTDFMFRLAFNGTPLVENTDYTMTLDPDMVNVGEKTITVKGIGNFTGELKPSFAINKKETTARITIDGDTTYTGSQICPTVKVYDVNSKVIPADQYTVTYGENVNAGSSEGVLTVDFSNATNYTITGIVDNKITEPFEIKRKSIQADWVTVTADFTYDGTLRTAEIYLNDGTRALSVNDYTVSGNTATAAGTYYITIEGEGNYIGKIENIEWAIAKATPKLNVTYNKLGSGQTLEDAQLNFTEELGVTGTLVWVDENNDPLITTTEVERGKSYKWLFTPDDTNYNTVSGEAVLWKKASSSGSSEPTLTPTVTQPTTGGKIEISNTSPTAGEVITVTPKADDGYTVSEIIVKDASGNTIEVTKNADGSYSFTQPDTEVTVEVSFKPLASFKDVKSGDWYESAVNFVVANGIMNGVSENFFYPNFKITRGMFATVLYNLAGKPEVTITNTYSDVKSSEYYAAPIAWATEQGIVNGMPSGKFLPNEPITREQMVKMLWVYLGKPEASGDLSRFPDGGKVSDYAQTAMAWAVENGVITGRANGTLDPRGTATRAEAARIFENYLDK